MRSRSDPPSSSSAPEPPPPPPPPPPEGQGPVAPPQFLPLKAARPADRLICEYERKVRPRVRFSPVVATSPGPQEAFRAAVDVGSKKRPLVLDAPPLARINAVVPDYPLPGSGEVPASSARGHILYVSGDVVACSRCGAYSSRGPRSQLFNYCEPKLIEDNPQRKWRRDNFMRGIHPRGPKGNPEIPYPSRLMVTDEAVLWLGLLHV